MHTVTTKSVQHTHANGANATSAATHGLSVPAHDDGPVDEETPLRAIELMGLRTPFELAGTVHHVARIRARNLRQASRMLAIGWGEEVATR